MKGRRRDTDTMCDQLAGWLLSSLSDERDRAEVLADFEALRRKRRRSRMWYWWEVAKCGWGMRVHRFRADSWTQSGRVSGSSRGRPLQSLAQDVRFGFRVLRRSPSLTLVALPTIALALGATTALFSFADALMLRPLPVRAPDRLFALFHVSTEGSSYSSFSHPDYIDLRDGTRTTEGVAAVSSTTVRIGEGPEAQSVEAQIVSGNYFEVLGVTPTIGRGFLAEEDRTPGTHAVVILSQTMLDRRFGGDRSIIGRSITLNGRSFTVVGVVPASTPSIDLGARPEVWVPLMMHEVVLPGFHAFGRRLFDNRGTHWLDLIARLPADVSVEVARAELQSIAQRQAEANPETNRGWSITAIPAAAARLGPPSSRPLARLTGLLTVVLAMVLLIACANVANLLLAKGSARFHEMAVRLSIGASRSRLIRQSLTEAVLLAALGGALGLVLAVLCVHFLPALNLTSGVAGLSVRLDTRVLLFASALTLCTGLVFGLVPALRASSAGVSRFERRSSAGGRASGPTMRQSLVVAQVALALVLLIGAGLAIRTLWNISRVPLGFDARDLVLAPLDLAQLPDSMVDELGTYEAITERAESLPGVRIATWAHISPFSARRMANDIFWETGNSGGTRGRTNVDMNVVDPSYFQTLDIPVITGRVFSRNDRAGSAGVAVVNQALADRLWPGESPIGKRLWEWRTVGGDRELEVIGLVANGRYYRSWQTADRPFLFVPLAQNPLREMTLHVRTSESVAVFDAALRRAVEEVIPGIAPPHTLTAQGALAAAISLQRTNARLLTLFAMLATLVAMIGVYGVVSFTVSQRFHEIGVRMALGARPAEITRMIVLGSARPIAIGSVLGLLMAAMLTRFLAPLLFGVGPWDPATFGAVGVLLIGLGLLAARLPARRATRIDPLVVLRD